MSNKTKEMNEDTHRALTPKLRFPEFQSDGDWTQTTLGSIAAFHKGRGVSKAEIDLMGNRACIRYGELYTRYGEIIDRVYSRTSAPDSELFLSCKNDIIIPASGETKDDIAKASCVMLDGVALGSDINVIRTECNGVFLSYYLNGAKGRDIAKIAQGDAVVHLYASQLEPLSISLPKSIEQEKIANCLRSLGHLITAHGQKLAALRAHKKALMQQLLPREGKTLPRLRFPEFVNAPEWAAKKLGSIGDIAMCKRVFNDQTNTTGGVPFFKIGTLGGNPDAFISKEIFELYKSKYSYPRKGEVLITCSGTVGKCLPYDGNDAYYQDSNIVWIDNPTMEIRNEFLYRVLSSIDWGKLNSTTITRIYGGDLRNLLIRFPSDHDEQRNIADCLSALDDLITAQSQMLSSLRNHKAGLLQQLFPSTQEGL